MNNVSGLQEILSNLNAEIQGIKNRGLDGLLAAGLIIQREAQKRVPVEFGFLKNSAYTVITSRNPPAVAIGFTAAYAIYVHESRKRTGGGDSGLSSADVANIPATTRPSQGMKLKKGHKPWEVGEPHFLANAVTAKASEVLDIIAKAAAL